MERGAYVVHRRRLLMADSSGVTADTVSRVTADTLCLRAHRAPPGGRRKSYTFCMQSLARGVQCYIAPDLKRRAYMPSSTVEFGLLLASVLLIAWRFHRFNGPHETSSFLSSYLFCSFWTWNHVPLPFRILLLKGQLSQLLAPTKFKTGGSKGARPRPRVGHGSSNLREVLFCAIVSSNLPRIEKPR
jgi:hypothetical protein